MKRMKIPLILILLLTIATALFLTIRIIRSPKTLNSEKAHSLYKNVTNNLSLDSFAYRITETKEMQLNKTATVTTQRTLQYFAKDTDGFSAKMVEDIQIGEHSIQATAYLSEDTLYYQTGAATFSGAMTQDAFLDRYAPFLLFDPQLYTSIHGVKNNGESTLFFTEASAPEAWTKLEDMEFLSANGSVIINADGDPEKFSYTCEYVAGGIPIKLSVATTPCSESQSLGSFEIPVNTTPISDPTATAFLDIACGYLLSNLEACAYYTDEIYCQAFDDRRIQTISLSTTPTEAKVITNITLQNSSKVGPQSDIHKTETFRDGLYTIRINNSDPTTDPQITLDKMQEYCQNILIGTIMLPEHISDVTISQSNRSVTYTFTGNESFANALRSEACNALYQDPNILTDQTQSYTTETATFYIEIDSITQLPKASGFLYQGVYTNDGLPYRLDYKAEQTYDLQ